MGGKSTSLPSVVLSIQTAVFSVNFSIPCFFHISFINVISYCSFNELTFYVCVFNLNHLCVKESTVYLSNMLCVQGIEAKSCFKHLHESLHVYVCGPSENETENYLNLKSCHSCLIFYLNYQKYVHHYKFIGEVKESYFVLMCLPYLPFSIMFFKVRNYNAVTCLKCVLTIITRYIFTFSFYGSFHFHQWNLAFSSLQECLKGKY